MEASRKRTYKELKRHMSRSDEDSDDEGSFDPDNEDEGSYANHGRKRPKPSNTGTKKAKKTVAPPTESREEEQ